jgi:hypothetical protein
VSAGPTADQSRIGEVAHPAAPAGRPDPPPPTPRPEGDLLVDLQAIRFDVVIAGPVADRLLGAWSGDHTDAVIALQAALDARPGAR